MPLLTFFFFCDFNSISTILVRITIAYVVFCYNQPELKPKRQGKLLVKPHTVVCHFHPVSLTRNARFWV